MKDYEMVNVLVPFDMVIDIDSGLLRLMSFDYRDDRYFNFFIFDQVDDIYNDIITQREDKNPLKLISNGIMSDDDLDKLYIEFLDTKYDEILNLSPPTTIFDIMKLAYISMDVSLHYTLLCNTKREKEIFDKFDGRANEIIIIENDDNTINYDDYNHIYINDIEDIDRLYNTIGKSIYIANCSYNKEEINNELVIKLDKIYPLVGKAIIKLIDLYRIDQTKIPQQIKEEKNDAE